MQPSLHQAAKALGGEVAGSQVLCPGPGHSLKDRSLAVRFDPTAPDGFVVYSHAGDDNIECRDYVRERLGMDPFEPGLSNSSGNHRFNGRAKPQGDPSRPTAKIVPPEFPSAKSITVLHDELRRHVYRTADGIEAVVKIKKSGGKSSAMNSTGRKARRTSRRSTS
jgi:hypothetical protein